MQGMNLRTGSGSFGVKMKFFDKRDDRETSVPGSIHIAGIGTNWHFWEKELITDK